MAPAIVGALLGCGAGACSLEKAQESGQARRASPEAKQEVAMESMKRRVPNVAPVTEGGVRYEVVRGARGRGFPQNGGVIAAIDVATGRERWALAVYPITYNADEEGDVQDVFITALRLSKDGQSLLVESEGKKRYAVNLTTKAVEVLP